MVKKFEFLDHTADMKFKAYGKDLEECFENSVLALADYMSCGKKISLKDTKKAKFICADEKAMLYKLIDEVLYLIDAEGFLAGKAKVKIHPGVLEVEFKGDRARKYKLKQLKAATYSEMQINKDKKCEVQAVVDV